MNTQDTRSTGDFAGMRSIRAVYVAMGKFRELNTSMPVGAVMTFLAVALNEGSSLTELSTFMDMKKSTAGRYLLDLSTKTRSGDDGYGLVIREQDPAELRRNMYTLSPKGRVLLRDMIGAVKIN